MIYRRKKGTVLLLFVIMISITLPPVQSLEQHAEKNSSASISYDKIINYGLQLDIEEKDLEKWYTSHPMVEYASLVENTMTIKFIDGSYTLLLDTSPILDNNILESIGTICASSPLFSNYVSDDTLGYSALLLNPSEYIYGNRHCKKIINRLLAKGYNIAYVSNEDVDIPYIRYNLSAELVYMNTHAGYWDIDGDQQADTVVIGTGEYWTDETENIYQFEYENKMIVKGMVGDKSFVCFTPAFVEYYYDPGDLPDSLIYMATCHATYDDSMANAFLESGASAYMGWTQNTMFLTNSRTSVRAFRLFTLGFSVQQVCGLIRYGGFFNFIYRSKLTYFGDGEYRLPTC